MAADERRKMDWTGSKMGEVASPSNAILNTPSSAILNTWVAWAAELGKLKPLVHTR